MFVRLVNQASQLCMDDTNSGTNPGDSVQEWTCTGFAVQNWQLHDMGSGYFSLQDQNSQLCLDNPSGENTPGTALQQWTCNDLSPQNWKFVSVGNGFYTLQNQAAGLMLDDPCGSDNTWYVVATLDGQRSAAPSLEGGFVQSSDRHPFFILHAFQCEPEFFHFLHCERSTRIDRHCAIQYRRFTLDRCEP